MKAEMRDGEKVFAVGLEFQQGADGDELVELRIVFEDLLGIVAAAGSELDVADDWRPVARGGGEGNRGDGMKRCDDVGVDGKERAEECGIEIMFLNDAPGKEIHRL